MGKAVGEVVGQCRSRGDLGHGEEGEGKRKVDQSEGPGRSALEGRSQGRGPGKVVLTHWGEEGYACNLEGRTVVAVGTGTLWGTVGAHIEKQKVVGECRSTSQGAVAGGTPVNLWLPQACASPQRGGPLASLGGPWHEVVKAYQVWSAQGPGDQEVILGHWDSLRPSSWVCATVHMGLCLCRGQ